MHDENSTVVHQRCPALWQARQALISLQPTLCRRHTFRPDRFGGESVVSPCRKAFFALDGTYLKRPGGGALFPPRPRPHTWSSAKHFCLNVL